MEPLKVLIADDEDDIRSVMEKRIASEGYQVVTAVDGEDAWQKIREEDPDLIILDLTMPKKDGMEVLTDLRKTPPSKKWQPVIIVSARSELKDIKQGLEMEADHYLTKPCQMEDVIKGIRLMQALIPQRNSDHN